MVRTTALLLLAFGVSGVSASTIPSPSQLAKWAMHMADGYKLDYNRRLQGMEGMPWTNPDCIVACPGASDLSTAMISKIAELTATTPPPEDAPTPTMDLEDMSQMMASVMQQAMAAMCEYPEAMACISQTEVCTATPAGAETSEEPMNMGMMGCLCSCPMVSNLLTVGTAFQANNGTLSEEMCPVVQGAMTCMEPVEGCAPVLMQMATDDPELVAAAAETCGITPPAGAPAPPPPPVVEISFTVKNVDLADLSQDDMTSMVDGYTSSIALAAGVPEDKVDVTLKQGSIVVESKIETADPEAVKETIAKPETQAFFATATKEMPALKKAIEAKNMTVADLEVSPITAAVVVPVVLPPTTATSDTTAQPATTSAARAHVAPALAVVAAVIALLFTEGFSQMQMENALMPRKFATD